MFIAVILRLLKRVTIQKNGAFLALNGTTQLNRDLKEFDITMVGVGSMIGSTVFIIIGLTAGRAGPSLLMAFLFNGFITLLSAMVYAELGSAIPEAGGGYLWIHSSMGKFQAFLSGWMAWYGHIVAGSLYALTFASFFVFLLQELGFVVSNALTVRVIVAVVAILIFLFINYLGTSETGLAGNIVTVSQLVIISVFVLGGFFAIFRHPLTSFQNLVPVFPNGLDQLILAMGFVFIAFEGYEIIVQSGEEVINPPRSIPRAIFFSLLVVIPVYFFVGFVSLAGIISPAGQTTWQFLGSFGEEGLIEAAKQFMPLGAALLFVGGLVSALSALNATIFSSARVSFAMGRDKFLPGSFGTVNKWRRTPHIGIIFSGVIMITVAVLLPIEDVVAAADLMFLILFLQVNLSVLIIRKRYGDRLGYGFKTPFFPWVPIAGMILEFLLIVILIIELPLAFIGTLFWIILGIAIWLLLLREKVSKTSKHNVLEKYIIPREDKND